MYRATKLLFSVVFRERVRGVGPLFVPWEGTVRPFNYTRVVKCRLYRFSQRKEIIDLPIISIRIYLCMTHGGRAFVDYQTSSRERDRGGVQPPKLKKTEVHIAKPSEIGFNPQKSKLLYNSRDFDSSQISTHTSGT